MMTMGSLFDGIGGFPLAAIHNGIIPVWASEIESFPMNVTKIRFPQMLHVGDITKLDGAKLLPVQVICGGSPCQDLSVAGQRRGLAGERSGLFMDQIRIVKEMRKADEGRGVPVHLIRPRFLVWENVPGAFSSCESEDFRAVLEEIVRIKDSACHVPRPDSRRWESAGAAILGDEFSLAWRVLDARYWGVPQRRRRIFLVADFGGVTAPEILFKQDCLSGDTAPGGGEGESTAGTVKRCTDDAGRACLIPPQMQIKTLTDEKTLLCINDQGGQRMDITGEMTATLRAGMGGHPPLLAEPFHEERPVYAAGFCGSAGAEARGIGYQAECSPTLKTGAAPSTLCLNDQGGKQMHWSQDISGTLRAEEHGHQPLVFDNHAQDSRFTGPVAVSQTVSAGFGMGGNNQPLVAQPSESFCIAGNIIDREVQNGGNGLGCQADISYTLTATDQHAVFSCQRSDEFRENEVTSTQSARQYKDATDLICQPYQSSVGTIGYTDYKGINNQYVSEDKCITEQRHLIRRLTPLECERLQGFPDGWTDIPGASDSARYKALGNSVAIPCVDFVLHGIAYFLQKLGIS